MIAVRVCVKTRRKAVFCCVLRAIAQMDYTMPTEKTTPFLFVRNASLSGSYGPFPSRYLIAFRRPPTFGTGNGVSPNCRKANDSYRAQPRR
jgi:hypothetical protein